MPYIDPSGGGNPLAQLMPLLQLMQQIQQQKAGQADANLARLPSGGAGMTADQAGLTPQQQKAKYGKVLAPTDVVAANTPQSQTTAMMLAKISAMSPEDTDQFTASMLNSMQGTPGIGTAASRLSAGKSATTNAATDVVAADTKYNVASTVHQTVLKGLDEISKAPDAVQAGIGQKAAGLSGPDEEASSALATSIKTQTQKLALQVLADPSHPLNKVMKDNLGFNAITAAPGMALGMQNLLDNVGQIAYQRQMGNKALEVAKFNAMLDEDKDVNKAESEWAKGVADNMGGTVSPRAVMNWKRWKEAGGDPGAMPQGVSSQLDTMLTQSTALAQRAFVTQKAADGDPYAKSFLDIAKMAASTNNKNQAQALSELMGSYYAKLMTASKYGSRPQDPQGQANWDAAAAAIQAKMPKLEAKSIFTGGGVDAVIPKTTLPTGAPTSSLAPNTPPPTSLNIGGKNVSAPPDMNPADLANIQAIIQALGVGAKPPLGLTPIKP